MRRTIIWLSSVVFAIVVLGLLAASYFIVRGLALGKFRAEIVAQVEAATGRSFSVGETLEIGFSKGLVIRANDLSLGNVDWANEAQLVSVGLAEARLALWPLLRGTLSIENVGLDDVELFLERDAAGRTNWTFDADEKSGGGQQYTVRSFRITSGSVSWQDAQPTGVSAIKLDGLDISAQENAEKFNIEGRAQIAGQGVVLKGSVTPPGRWSNEQPIAFDVALDIDNMALEAKGTIETSASGPLSAAQLSGREIDINQLGKLVGQELPKIPLISADMNVSSSADAWSVENLALKVGRSDIGGDLRVATDGQRPTISGELSAESLDVAELLLPRDNDALKTSASPAKPTRFFSDEPIDLSVLRRFDSTLRLKARRMTLPGGRFDDVQINGKLSAGRLSLDLPNSSIDGAGKLVGHASLDATVDPPTWSSAFVVEDLPSEKLLGSGQSPIVRARISIEYDLKTRGASVHSMASNLSGQARLVMGKGRAKTKAIDRLVGGLSTLTGQLLEQGAEDAELNCIISDVVIDRGVAEARVMLIDSVASTLRGEGSIDLGNERIDLTFMPRPKKPTFHVAVPVYVRGSLQSPRFQADKTASLIKLIGIAGAFVYPPAAVVALGDLGAGATACGELIQGGTASAPSQSMSETVIDGVTGAAKSIGRGLKGLLPD